MKLKFQPTPSRISAPQKCSSSSPIRAITPEAPVSSRPSAVTGSLPQRAIRRPVTKLGANMASTCHCTPRAASPTLKPQPTMAMGVAVIRNAISP